jgi:hypothetical protein
MEKRRLCLCSIFLFLVCLLFFVYTQAGNLLLSGFVNLFCDMIKAVFLPILDFLSRILGGF